MSAVRLREAAGLMRERAEKAEARCWWPAETHDGMERISWADATETGVFPDHGEDPVNDFIQAWEPAAQIAVADWLDEEARWVDSGNEVIPAALAVANAYLGNPA